MFDRLIPEQDRYLQGLSIQQLRESVAHDLEDLLNSRVAKFDQEMTAYPLARKSVLQFGIIDFVGLSTANPLDRETICHSIEQSIEAHEPRLKQVKVEMLLDGHNMGSLCLSIQAYLNIYPLYEPVLFDALLKPTTQQYVISART
ncbi:lysozyme family protein [Acinetobacter sp. 263903-1]|uniref:Type VI secretion system lysozyme-related protein n=1 Tax=Acinetobacter radioresistens SK82 TaxID=596318 RepID=A0ABP2GPA9_ACIRA|nr:type VI secretion system lysozyme-related protein [Acinetobacter radioresistens SK82]EXB34023.1 lysozyme family protein [Acinetobacter sp. 1461402]EXB73881.1 lysozyme family protein [Acinetobacter sp. 230853]EXB85430.1 lysozyme family protein [Acinetobacter sp. 272263]EXC32138.1 lysozyme family protein [Acinetobacter sp. 869535]EXE14160.1 lysozyme family protein [Acinetobacter sp. 983759]EXE60981.1 lysozyme family protein [Acinetobacter sp. 1239920]EXF58180.1 lysozyme family protein [Acin